MKIYTALYKDDAHLAKYGQVETVYHPSQLQDPGILILHGGEDISPSLYKQDPIPECHAGHNLSNRDLSEKLLAERAIELGIGIYGICRGAQLSCALAGGTLVQHADNHGHGKHEVKTKNEIFFSTSCHHQMMNPFHDGVEYEMLGVSQRKLSPRYLDETGTIKMPVEPELIFFPKIKALAVQGHPEWMSNDSPYVKFLDKLVQEKLL